jgi:hypothetical protein
MAKTRKPTQKQLLARSLESYQKHRIECCICGKTDSGTDMAAATYADYLHSDGWRYSESDKFCVMGPMCHDCLEIPDAERGE